MRAQDQASLVELTPANVVLSSLRLVPSSPVKSVPEVELRLYETIGSPTDVVIRLARSVQGVQETNFLGRPTSELGRIEIRSDGIHLHLPPWKIANLRLRM